MYKLFVKIISIITCIALFTACSNTAETEVTGEEIAVKETEKASGNGSASDSQVTISFLTQVTEERNESFWKAVLDDFEAANPGIRVNMSSYPDVNKKIDHFKVLFASGQLPDVIFAGLDEAHRIDGALMPLPEDSYSHLQAPAVFKNGQGEVVKLASQGLTMQNVFYNKDVFDRYDISEPTTWAEFEALCQKLKDNGEVPLIAGAKANTVHMAINPLMNAFLYDVDPNYEEMLLTGELKFNGPEIVGAVEKYVGLWEKGYYHEASLALSNEQYQAEFCAGNAVMLTHIPIFTSSWVEKADFTLGWFNLPGPDSNDIYPVMYGDAVGISKASEHTEEALVLLNYLLSRDVLHRVTSPVNTIAPLIEPLEYDVNYAAAEVIDKTKELTPVTAFMKLEGHPPGFGEAFRTACIDAVYGGDVQTIFDELETKYRDLLAAQ